MFFIKQLTILQLIIPFAASCISIIIGNKLKLLNIIAIIASALSLSMSIILMTSAKLVDINYFIGNWSNVSGIEYKVSLSSELLLSTISSILLIFLIFIAPQMHENLKKHRFGYLFYSLILLYYTGSIGIIATNDIFNFYVFLEIMSLTSYVILSYGPARASVISALEYLIIGSIAATFILLTIWVLLYLTGSLNITDIHNLVISGSLDSNMLKIGIAFFSVGALIKIGLMPFNFWMIRSYESTNVANLIFLAPISSITNFYILIKLTDFIFNKNLIFDSNVILALATISLCVFSYFAFCAKKLRTIIIYSSFVSIAYGFLIYYYANDQLIFRHLVADALSKCALFSIILELESKKIIYLEDMNKIRYNKLFIALASFCLLNNAGMPFTIIFMNKISLLQHLLDNMAIVIFACVIIASFAAFLYNYKLFESLYIRNDNNETLPIKANKGIILTLLIINILSFALIFMPI